MKTKFLSKLDQLQFNLSPDLKAILVGLLLGDLYARKRTKTGNTLLMFEQGIVHKDYIYHLYDLFSNYCRTAPKLKIRAPDKRTGVTYSSIRFQTYSLPCFNELFHMFYPEGPKVVPSNIAELLTPLSLAYWISDDGSFCKTKSIVTLCTESFTLEEVTLLANTLNTKWDLKCYINKTNNGGFRILIPRKSLPVLQSLLKDIMPSMMEHKIGL
jgi:hypothetical protein